MDHSPDGLGDRGLYWSDTSHCRTTTRCSYDNGHDYDYDRDHSHVGHVRHAARS